VLKFKKNNSGAKRLTGYRKGEMKKKQETMVFRSVYECVANDYDTSILNTSKMAA